VWFAVSLSSACWEEEEDEGYSSSTFGVLMSLMKDDSLEPLSVGRWLYLGVGFESGKNAFPTVVSEEEEEEEEDDGGYSSTFGVLMSLMKDDSLAPLSVGRWLYLGVGLESGKKALPPP
jgi:hypothetical protein